MSARAITKEFVDAVVLAFAASPGNAAAVAAQVGCDHRTAKKAWSQGWPKYGVPPVSETIAEQQAAARALANRNANAKVEGTRDAQKEIKIEAALHAAKDREREGAIARAARDNALALQAVSMNLVKRGHIMTQNMSDADLQALPVSAQLKALKTMAEFAEKAAICADKAITLHRLIMGEPTEHVAHEHRHEHNHEHVHTAPADMVAVIARAQVAVERAKAAGILDAEVLTPDSEPAALPAAP